MPTSAAGNKPVRGLRAWSADRAIRSAHGFTLIELLVVVTLIVVATAGVILSLRDSAADALERDAQRLAAVLEAGRAQSRANGTPVLWQAQADGFVLQGLLRPETAQAWLSPHTRVQPAAPVALGPEPLIPPRQIVFYSTLPGGHTLRLVTDGLRPFEIRRDAGTP